MNPVIASIKLKSSAHLSLAAGLALSYVVVVVMLRLAQVGVASFFVAAGLGFPIVAYTVLVAFVLIRYGQTPVIPTAPPLQGGRPE